MSDYSDLRLENEQRRWSDEEDVLRKEVERWKYIAAYLASCHAANLSIAELARTSKYERGRFRSIMEKTASMLSGETMPPKLVGTGRTVDEVVKDAADRCRSCAEKVKA